MGESEEELKSLLMNIKEESENVGLKLNFLHSATVTSIHDHWKNHSLDLDGPLVAK